MCVPRFIYDEVPPNSSSLLREHRAAATIQHAYRGHRKRQAAARKIQNFMRQSRIKLRKMHESSGVDCSMERPLEDGVSCLPPVNQQSPMAPLPQQQLPLQAPPPQPMTIHHPSHMSIAMQTHTMESYSASLSTPSSSSSSLLPSMGLPPAMATRQQQTVSRTTQLSSSATSIPPPHSALPPIHTIQQKGDCRNGN